MLLRWSLARKRFECYPETVEDAYVRLIDFCATGALEFCPSSFKSMLQITVPVVWEGGQPNLAKTLERCVVSQ